MTSVGKDSVFLGGDAQNMGEKWDKGDLKCAENGVYYPPVICMSAHDMDQP